ncbi:CCR4-Not complex component, Not1-domain-containing protein [Calycina marina]|uniref:General negative regulator of transcription subunit 1 n=1 Tax=Calycina marina TaxID=1763456 RepID=A0A9P7Z8P8_9HELO|nr:CCR4-Not complex component, Not1-domain-containing protein [Calycina marina]
MVNSRAGTFTPSPAQQTLITGINHSPQGSHHSTFSAGASPSTNSPTGGSSSLINIIIAQVYLLLGTIRHDDKDRIKWDQLRKLIDDNGMEVFQKYFTRMVVANSGQIFPGHNRTATNTGNYQLLVDELGKVSTDVEQAGRIAEAIETANEDLFRDFDLSTFMEHFKLGALEKTILALALKLGSRPDLRTKADAILSINFSNFLGILASPNAPEYRFIQHHPPNFDQNASDDLEQAVRLHYGAGQEGAPPTPTEVLSALYLNQVLNKQNPLISAIQGASSNFTADLETCRQSLRSSRIDLDDAMITDALIYTAISRTIRKESTTRVEWKNVVQYFDQPDLRITKDQFFSLYVAFFELANEEVIEIEQLWAGEWRNPETQLSFIAAFSSLSSDQLDATTIPNLHRSFTLQDFEGADADTQSQAVQAVKHPLVSLEAVAAMFNVALQSASQSDTVEAKRLFQQVVVPNLHIFLVSAFGIPKPWPLLAVETINSLFERFIYKYERSYDLVLENCWRKDKSWVIERLIDAHAKQPLEIHHILEHSIKHDWTGELIHFLNGFGLDFAALAYTHGILDLHEWARAYDNQHPRLADSLLKFLDIKAQHELQHQRSPQEPLHSTMLTVKTVATLLEILVNILPKEPSDQLIAVQRMCIKAYPRLINYGGDFDGIIDANGADSNSLPETANAKMEEHYKRMYSEETDVRAVVQALEEYKTSREPSEQDIFACMIHGLFDEYELYNTYPMEALATTAVLFGGIIQQDLLSGIPLEIGLGMILEAVREHSPDEPMHKFGFQALRRVYGRLSEWPGFCRQLLHVENLAGTEPYLKAQAAWEAAVQSGGALSTVSASMMNGCDEPLESPEDLGTDLPKFLSLWVDSAPENGSDNPDPAAQEKVQFVLNNITGENLKAKFEELKDNVEEKHQQWLAGHIVNNTAKTMPNYHKLYLDLIGLFGQKSLWAEILRETYSTCFRMLNSEMRTAMERTQLKNLGGWLGSVTLARDKPILHNNIAFNNLLCEAYDTQRLPTVIPFVCKVLVQGQFSTVFKPPNPWLMEIIHLLIELYHSAELKLNLKFEIEVLCKELKLDHKTLEPSDVLSGRVVFAEEASMPQNMLDRFDNLDVNGLPGAAPNGRFSPQEILSSLPDLGPMLTYPPGNDMVDQSRLHDILRAAINRAVQEIIAPVVERSVTIAAISTAQMIHKDFATEPDEARVRSAAIKMVKKTAGSLALVTSKEPLRASMTNYIRTMATQGGPQGLPEGTIIMCVNSNLDLACSQVEAKAEERAVPEIEDMIETELEARRHWNMTRPNEPYRSDDLTRWSLTMPDPYKLQPNHSGLNSQQMSIYEEFARQPRHLSLGGSTHLPATSDGTRSITHEILHDQYTGVSNISMPQEQPSMTNIGTQQQLYALPNITQTNGRGGSVPNDARQLQEVVWEILGNFEREAEGMSERHYHDVTHQHNINSYLDQLHSFLIKYSQGAEALDLMVLDGVCQKLFGGIENTLVIESLVVVLESACRIAGRAADHVVHVVQEQTADTLLNIPLLVTLLDRKMIEWQRVDAVISKALQGHKDEALEFFSSFLDTVLMNDRPIALYNDLSSSLKHAWEWIEENPTLEAGQALKEKLSNCPFPQRDAPQRVDEESTSKKHDQMTYVFDEWVALCNNRNTDNRYDWHFIADMYNSQLINSVDDICIFLRLAIDTCVERFETFPIQTAAEAFAVTSDPLARLIVKLVVAKQSAGEVQGDKSRYLKTLLSVCVLLLNHHHVRRGDAFNQKFFVRFFSSALLEMSAAEDDLSESERREISLVFADTFAKLEPNHFPGFAFGWMTLISHREFLPILMSIPEDGGWKPYANIMVELMRYLGTQLISSHLSDVSELLYHGSLKLLLVLQHDYPEFLAAHHAQLLAYIPSHCTYLHNMILTANPAKFSKVPDPFQPGLKVDRLPEIRQSQQAQIDAEVTLRKFGLFEALDQALQNGPGEDIVASLAHEIQVRRVEAAGFHEVPINVDIKLIEAVMTHTGAHAVSRANETDGPNFVPGSPAARLLTMLVRELRPEARYNLLGSIVNQIRFPNNETHFFQQALLAVWGRDFEDPEETDIRQQITRILLERLLTNWPQPWGLNIVCMELIKNDTYKFFGTPFIKSSPEIAERFVLLTQNMASQ